jgi:hypothetical protein
MPYMVALGPRYGSSALFSLCIKILVQSSRLFLLDFLYSNQLIHANLGSFAPPYKALYQVSLALDINFCLVCLIGWAHGPHQSSKLSGLRV